MTHYPIRIRRYTDPSAARVVRFASIVVAHTTVYARPLDATDLRCATALKTRDADSPLEASLECGGAPFVQGEVLKVFVLSRGRCPVRTAEDKA